MPARIDTPPTFLSKKSRAEIIKRFEGIKSESAMNRMLDSAEVALGEYWFANLLDNHRLPARPGKSIQDAQRGVKAITHAVTAMSPLVAKRFFRYLGLKVAKDTHPLSRELTGQRAYVNQLKSIFGALEYASGRTKEVRGTAQDRMYNMLLLDLAFIWPEPFQWRKYGPTHKMRPELAGTAFIQEVLTVARKNASPKHGCLTELRLATEPIMRTVLEKRAQTGPADRNRDRSGGRTAHVRQKPLRKLGAEILGP